MPVESTQDAPFVQYHHPSHHHRHHHFLPCYAEDLDLVHGPDDLCLTNTAEHIAASAATAALTLDSNDNLISTHSPPLINLSPNLSPSSESRVSPFYDFRETTRRRSAQGKFCLEGFLFSFARLTVCDVFLPFIMMVVVHLPLVVSRNILQAGAILKSISVLSDCSSFGGKK